jgi:tripartite ATP-independent transporter DctP family solute receptor
MRKAMTAALCAAVCALSALSATAGPLVLRFGTPFVSGSNLHKGMEKFAEVVAAESKGEIKVQVYTDSQIGDMTQLITGMQLGTVDMAYLGVANAGQLKGGAPLNVAYTPYLFKSKDQAARMLNGPIFTEMYDTLAKESGLRIFAVAGNRSPRALLTTRGPIKKPEELRGMRLRIPPIDMFRAMFEQLGVKVVPLGLNDVYMALSKGQVEGQDNGFDLSLSFRFHEVSKFYSATDHVYDVAAWYISERRWRTLNPAQQELLRRAAQAGGKVASDLGDQIDRQGVEDLKKAGVTYTVPDIAAFRAAWKDVHKSYEGKVWPAGLVDRIRAAQQ